MPSAAFLRVREVAGHGPTSDALVGEGLAVAVAAMAGVGALGRAAFGMYLDRQMG